MSDLYRPSNGSEGDWFQRRWCDRCTKDDYAAGMFCPIIASALALYVDEAGYPTEWCCDANGDPQCTAFEPYGDADNIDAGPPVKPSAALTTKETE